VSGFGSRGEVIDTVPTFDAAGQVGASSELSLNCAGVQAFSPFAADGLSVIPGGSVTDALWSIEVAWVVASGACGTFRSIVAPVGSSARVLSAVIVSEGLKGSDVH
jgi:hypothetical protein